MTRDFVSPVHENVFSKLSVFASAKLVVRAFLFLGAGTFVSQKDPVTS
jgi:hypothetical protein